MNNAAVNTGARKSYLVPMIIISVLFFIFGFVTWLNGILIPYLKIACELTNYQALFVAFAFYISYFVMALPSSWVLKKTGFKNGMTIGLWVMAIGTLIFIPAALSRTFSLFLTGLFVMGTGLALLQTASNPYVTVLGPIESAAKRISVLGICNKLAGAIAPLVLAYYILSDGDTFVQNLSTLDQTARVAALDGLARRVIGPYIVMTIFLFLMGIGVRLAHLPDIETEEDEEQKESLAGKKNIFAFPHLVFGVIALFFYVGAEVIAGDTIIRYGISLGIEIDKAKAFTSYTMLAMTIGYIIGIVLTPKYLSQRVLLQISAVLGLVLAMGVLFTSGFTSVFFVALFGLANAIVWPAIWPLAIHGLGRFIKTGSAMLIMAIAGGATLPLLWGKFADNVGSTEAYWIVVPCYLIIFAFATWGYKLKSWK